MTTALPAPALDLLTRRVPLTLLLDLALGPHSRELLDEERTPQQRS